jgi:hypothetical protein
MYVNNGYDRREKILGHFIIKQAGGGIVLEK